jgi:multiple antibiotic resistance protein
METAPWSEYAKFFAALLAIVNPLGAVPVFINVTGNLPDHARKETALWAAIATGLILWVALLAGEAVLRFFGISIGSFRVGGGILILLMAISMLHAKMSSIKHTEEEMQDVEARESMAVVPLGTPLLAGPGAISTVILYAQRGSGLTHYALIAAGIAVLALITWLLFRAAPPVAAYLGRTGINVVTRIMGLIMAAVGVEFIVSGLKQLLPILGG